MRGHALTLNLFGTYLRDFEAGDICKRTLVDLADADVEGQRGHAGHVMDLYVLALSAEGARGAQALAVLRVLGLFDRSAEAGCLGAIWNAPAIPGLTEPLVGLTDGPRNVVLKRLEDAKLLTVLRDGVHRLVAVDTHPHIRDYFARHLRTEHPEAWREAHRRLYMYLCATTKEGARPTLEELQPLYQAVAHGCHAGLQQDACAEVYHDRLQRGREAYSTFKLGAFGSDLGAVASFFETPWSRVSSALTEDAQAWLLNEAAFTLRGLGRLMEALEPMRASREMCIQQEDWPEAAIRAGNLSELELTLGDVVGALRDAEQGVAFADLSGDTRERMINCTTHADALHQAGRRADAETLFREAERIQAERQPQYPVLYSLGGFRYCDHFLAAPERAAWNESHAKSPNRKEELGVLTTLREVLDRTSNALQFATDENAPLHTVALDHLTLGRAALFEAILGAARPDFCAARVELDQAVSGLRRAGQQQYIPPGLLSRAWLRAMEGTLTGPNSAQEDLDEAWEIAARGAMQLFMADILLYRARLFGRETNYPWGSARVDLAEARRLIKTCGYLRRTGELEDAETACRDWPDRTRTLTPTDQPFLHPVDKAKSMPVTTQTVLELDLVGYSTIAATLEDGVGAEISLTLNKQIQGFIDDGLTAAGVTRAAAVMQTTGDGAILVFDRPTQAHVFADAVQQATRTHNAGKPPSIGKRVFRIGVSTGELVKEPREGGGFEIGGMAIARAVRLEAKANPGEVLCDTNTYNGLTAAQQKRYSGVETIAGKRDEKFAAHRCVLYPDGVKDAEFFTAPPTKSPAEDAPPKPAPAVQGDKANRKEVLALFKELKGHQFVELLFLLDVPIKLRPAKVLNFEEQKNELLTWAAEAKELDALLSELRELVGVTGNP